MAVFFPELDNSLSGAADLWDDGLAGAIITADYFQAAAPGGGGGQIKIWSGAIWAPKPVKVWNGTAWITKPVKVWNGTAWVETNY